LNLNRLAHGDLGGRLHWNIRINSAFYRGDFRRGYRNRRIAGSQHSMTPGVVRLGPSLNLSDRQNTYPENSGTSTSARRPPHVRVARTRGTSVPASFRADAMQHSSHVEPEQESKQTRAGVLYASPVRQIRHSSLNELIHR
jgi:hypothetical protein